MKKIKLTLLLFVMALYCGVGHGQTKEFVSRAVVDGYGPTYYFIPIHVKSDEFRGTLVVESRELFEYLQHTKGVNADSFKSLMSKALMGGTPLDMKNVSVDKSGLFLEGPNIKERTFRVVKRSPEFESVAAQGCVQLLRYYFSPEISDSKETKECKDKIRAHEQDLFIRPRFGLTEQNNVIVMLFKIDIPVTLDDISGSLKIGFRSVR